MDEIGLPAEEGRRLQHVHDAGNGSHVGDLMHVGEDRHADLAADLVEQLEAGFEPRTARRDARAAVGLVVGGLEDVGDAEARAHFLHVPGDLDAQFERLSGARTGDQEERMVETDLEAAQLHACFRRCKAACTKEVNSG